jgi:N-acetylglucosamine kinase-like BadF-type ATPase
MTTNANAKSPSQHGGSHCWPSRLYLAVDCGGTKAAAAICDEKGRLIGRGRGGPSNFTDERLDLFLNNVEVAVKNALKQVSKHYAPRPSPNTSEGDDEEGNNDQCLGTTVDALKDIKPDPVSDKTDSPRFQAAWFGIAGVDSPADVTRLSPHLANMFDLPCSSERLIVANDTSLLASPITDASRPDIRSGVVVIAGTGSIVMSFKRSRNGMLKTLGRVGGLGWLLGDEGSGYSVGRAAVRRVLDLADREKLAREWEEGAAPESEEDGEDCPTSSDSEGGELVVNGGLPNGFLAGEDAQGDGGKGARLASANTCNKSKADDCTKKSRAAYGHLLRDRILQDWNLLSTDGLLRAVYLDDVSDRAATSSSGKPSIARHSFSSDDPYDNISHAPSSTTHSMDPSAMTLSQARQAPSINLPPPTTNQLPETARRQGHSPAPSFSSSLSDKSSSSSSSAAQRHPHTRGQGTPGRPSSASPSLPPTHDPSGSSPKAAPERKHKLASLAPLVFHLAFSHGDALCRDILQSQASLLALQVRDVMLPAKQAKAHISAPTSVLCLGGGLVGQADYRNLLLDELRNLNIIFAAVEYVADPATRGAVALSSVLEERGQLRES